MLADSREIVDDDLAAPNNNLGIEYLLALRLTRSAIVPLTMRRRGAGYHETAVTDSEIASATGIRRRLQQGEEIVELVPDQVFKILCRAQKDGCLFSSDRYLQQLLGQIFRAGPAGLRECHLVTDGIENRVCAIADRVSDHDGLIAELKSRHLTRTRVQRLLISILLGFNKEVTRRLLTDGPGYLHLLGVSERGRAFVAAGRKRRALPLIQNFSRVYAILKRRYGMGSESYGRALEQLALELRATRIFSLIIHNYSQSSRNYDFYQPLITKPEESTDKKEISNHGTTEHQSWNNH